MTAIPIDAEPPQALSPAGAAALAVLRLRQAGGWRTDDAYGPGEHPGAVFAAYLRAGGSRLDLILALIDLAAEFADLFADRIGAAELEQQLSERVEAEELAWRTEGRATALFDEFTIDHLDAMAIPPVLVELYRRLAQLGPATLVELGDDEAWRAARVREARALYLANRGHDGPVLLAEGWWTPVRDGAAWGEAIESWASDAVTLEHIRRLPDGRVQADADRPPWLWVQRLDMRLERVLAGGRTTRGDRD